MKQQIPMPAMIAAIVAILAVVCLLGFRMLKPDTSRETNAPTGPTAEEKMRYEAMHNGAGPGGPGAYGARSSANMPGYPGSGGAGSGGR